MCKLILCRGIQGSGKSTWAKKWAEEDPERRIRFSNDDIRNMFGKYWVPNREKLVENAKYFVVLSAMSSGYDIVIDNMNLNPKEFEYYLDLSRLIRDSSGINYEVSFQDFKTPLEECIKRDSLRPNPIGEEVIRNTYNKYIDFYSEEK